MTGPTGNGGRHAGAAGTGGGVAPGGEAAPEGTAPGGTTPPSGLADVFGAFAGGVTLVTVADGRDDVGTTVSAFCPISLSPPLVLLSLIASSHLGEALGGADARVERFAVTVLAAGQRVLAGRFMLPGRPGARRLLEGVSHHRGAATGALIPDGGMAALECAVARRVPAGDHVLVLADVLTVPYVAAGGDPLVRFRGRYPRLVGHRAAAGSPARG